MRQLHLLVDGMSCRRCVREVTARLRDVPGVETVSASAADSVVRLSGSMQLADVLAAFTSTTYRPRPDGPDRDGPTGDGPTGVGATGEPDRGQPSGQSGGERSGTYGQADGGDSGETAAGKSPA